MMEFGEVIEQVKRLCTDIPQDVLAKVVVVRNFLGKIIFLFNFNGQEKRDSEVLLNKVEANCRDQLNHYVQEPAVFCACDLIEPEQFFDNPDILILADYDAEGNETFSVKFLERQITGQDWLRPKNDPHKSFRLAFYGFKGGVGRSTAVAAVAFLLANSGKKVLVLDFDLESPGLSTMLLPQDMLPKNGIVDWLIEDAVGNTDDGFLGDMYLSSPLATNSDGAIKVVTAMGGKISDPIQTDPNYISKLSRIYTDLPNKNGQLEHFSDRLERLVDALETKFQPDVVLIDCRAGLHDLSAGSIMRIANKSFFFIIDTPQSWQGYRTLFSHWQYFPQKAREIRERIKTLHALIPVSDWEERRKGFLEQSYQLFSDTLYDSSGPEYNEKDFSFNENDTEAPHYPLDIQWNASLSEFSYQSLANEAVAKIIESVYGEFFNQIQSQLNDVNSQT